MVNWQVTATTIYCDAVDDEVTLMVYKDGSIRCTGYHRYYEPDKDAARLMASRGKQVNRKLECEGLECRRVTQYRDKVFAEESGREAADSKQGAES